ncbi:SAP domain-containing protein [Wolffia australiana]
METVIDVDSEEEWEVSDESECVGDDSEEDPTYDHVEEARAKLSRMRLGSCRTREAESENPLELAEEDQETCDLVIDLFDRVAKKVKDGEINTLTIEECKVYLRRYSLRLSGNKAALQARIKEYLEISEGGGLKRYPVSSFNLNCKGDACTGDVVMFEQTGNVSRIVAGRVVKESYGAAKQQHTFTIEVLWSKGKKPLPALYPLLIKGRNLYKMKTMRQEWADEGKRQKVLEEKHRRGNAARCNRETRIREKEARLQAFKEPRNKPRTVGSDQRENIPPVLLEIPRPSRPELSNRDRWIEREINHHRTILPPVGRYPHGGVYPPSISCYGNPTRMMGCYDGGHGAGRSDGIIAHRPMILQAGFGPQRQKPLCLHFLQRRCRYGNSCKFSHLERENGMSYR